MDTLETGILRFTRFQSSVGALLATLAINAAHAADQPKTTTDAAKPEPSAYDNIWKYTEWYKNADNPVIQKFNFTGRFQLDYALLDADQGNHNQWNIRRFRLGGKAQLFKDFTLHGEVDLDPLANGPVYQRITDLYLAWSQNKAFVASVGKQSAPFTMDGSTSSKELIAIDRSNLANNFWYPQEYVPGVTISGKPGPWVYHLGVYSSGAANKEFGEFNGGYFGLATIGYDFKKQLDVKEAVLTVNYVHNDPDINNTFTRSLENVGSVNFKFDTGKWGVRTDLTAATGYLGQSDAWGAMVMPFYNITKNLQAVARYTHLSSDKNKGLRLARYESSIVAKKGDEYNEAYLGLNYYFYGHKLKLQTGVQYADMVDHAKAGGDYSGLSWTTGLRIGW